MFPSLEITLLTNPPGIEHRQIYTTVHILSFLSLSVFLYRVAAINPEHFQSFTVA
jgi:hypothetical protein